MTAALTDQGIIDEILEREGGGTYTDREDDAGGPTRWGITQATLAAYRGHPVTPGEVAALPEAEARAIYERRYITEPGFDRIADPELRALVVDCAVLHGQGSAVQMLQRALGGLMVDGVFGPLTQVALNGKDVAKLWTDVMAERLMFLGRRISKSKLDADHDGMTDAAEEAAGHINRCALMMKEQAESASRAREASR